MVDPYVEELAPPPDPVDCCEKLAGLPYRLLLDSAARTPRLGRYSFLAADPAVVVRAKGARTDVIDLLHGTCQPMLGDALDVVRGLLAPHVRDPIEGLPPFQGGAAGHIGYDWGLTLEPVPPPRFDDLDVPDIVLGLYDWVLAWDHQQSKAWVFSTGFPEPSPNGRRRRAEQRATFVLDRLDADTPAGSMTNSAPPPLRFSEAPSHALEGWWSPRRGVRSSFTRDGYLAAVERVRAYIRAGDIFQANLSQRFEAVLDVDPWTLYCSLRSVNPAPFGSFIESPGLVVLSASPERFLRLDPSGHVETRPIKGTRPRAPDAAEDAALAAALVESAKDRAENLMIVDLMRNDLSRVCAPGTVRVPELWALEHYATVHHLVSTVVGDLEPDKNAVDLLHATFPGGSVTGAPKVRAMQIISELEPSRRGVYCGSIGYWSMTRALDVSIAIRTAVVRHGRLYFGAGGGIVADSDPDQEYLETLDKARGIIDALEHAR